MKTSTLSVPAVKRLIYRTVRAFQRQGVCGSQTMLMLSLMPLVSDATAANKLGMSIQALSTALSRLEKKGLLIKLGTVSGERTGRPAFSWCLSPAGEALFTLHS
jgi:predicted ArsR family transcriptional regulator